MSAASAHEEWQGKWTATALVVVLCTGISLSNALELLLLILITFKRRKGLYFWSLLITSFAVLPYSIGFLVEYLVSHTVVPDIINNIGWVVMVTGQSVVLYSRLGIICHDPKLLRFVLWMIIADGVVFYIATTVVHYGTYSDVPTFNQAAHVIEKIQMTGFSVQEFIISGIYMREVVRYLKVVTHENTRRTIWELGVINVIIVALDVALLTLEYLNLTVLEQTFKGLAYSFKLKMEFAILGKLVDMAHPGLGVQDFDDRMMPLDAESLGSRSKSTFTHASFV